MLKAFIAVLLASCALSAQSLLFKSGFESATKLGPVTGVAPTGPEQTISGTDASTGSTWPIIAFSPNPGLDGIHTIPPHTSTDSNASHFLNSIDTGNFHSGSSSLNLEMTGYADNSCCAQNVLNMVGMSQSITSLYERVWVKLGPEVSTQISAHPTDFWRDLFEIKTQDDFRIITYVYKNSSSSSAYFFVQNDNGALNSPTQTFWATSCLPANGCSVSVPLNQWFLEEIYLKRSSGSDGQFFFAINGQTVVNHMGPNLGGSFGSEPIYQWMIQNEYGIYFPMQEWLDDLELWSAPPCASLPCGTGSTGGGSTATAPSITSTSPLAVSTVGAAYSVNLSSSGTTPITWSITSGALPPGISLSSGGALSGNPTTAGAYTFTATAANSAGSNSKSFSLTINPNPSTTFPAVISSFQTLFQAADSSHTTLSASLNSSATSISVSGASTFVADQVIRIDNEQIEICSVSSGTFTACSGGRGIGGTTAASHSSGADVYGRITAIYGNTLNTRLIELETWAAAHHLGNYGCPTGSGSFTSGASWPCKVVTLADLGSDVDGQPITIATHNRRALELSEFEADIFGSTGSTQGHTGTCSGCPSQPNSSWPNHPVTTTELIVATPGSAISKDFHNRTASEIIGLETDIKNNP